MLLEKFFPDIDSAHGGRSYDILCFRLFMKFGHYDISDDESKDPVGIVRACKHCKHSNENLKTLRSHMRHFDKNPDGEENRKKGVFKKRRKKVRIA